MKNYTDKVLLFDGTALAYRSFYAFFRNPLRNSKGKNVSAVFGVLKTVKRINEIYNPDYIAFCFDSRVKTKRKELYPDYKATRQKTPDELLEQIPVISKIISALGFNFIEVDGYEADDIISSIAKQNDKKTIVISSDKDIAQIVNKRINIADPSKPEILLDEEGIYKKYGVFPNQIIDYLALVGDNSDNIPGIPGIGPKTASSLIHDFGNIENIYDNIDKIKSRKIRENLINYRERLNLAKELIKLNDSLDVGTLTNYRRKQPNYKSITGILRELELWTLIDEFSSGREQLSLFGANSTNNEIEVINEFNDNLKIADAVNIFFSDNVISLGNDKETKLFDIINENKILSSVIKKCKTIVTNDAKRIHRFQFENNLNNNVKINDIRIASALIFGGLKRPSDKNIIREFITDLPKEKIDNEKTIVYILSKNNSDIWRKIEEKLRFMQLTKLYNEIELPLAKVLALMEYNGITVDITVLEAIRKDFTKKIEELIEKCKQYTGEINLNSPKQLASVLFEKLKLPVIRKTKTGYSTDNETLSKLVRFHPLPALIIKYREYMKFKTSYIDSFPTFIDSESKIHTTFNQINVDTGRLSSNNPNLQNIPARSEEGKRLRQIFIAKKGFMLVSFDYSQIELRIMAHMSGDRNLINAFETGLDIHRQTASLIFGVSEDNVTNDMRREAKVINFGIMYGMSPYGLSRELNISLNDAKTFIENYFKNYTEVKMWIDNTIEYVRKNKYVKTLMGRLRYIPTINSKNKNEFEFAKRIAINTPIQGSAAELIKMAMLDIYKHYNNSENIRMLLQIHDELIFEIEKGHMREIDTIKEIMSNTFNLTVPVTVTVGMGKSWYEASK